MLQNRLISWAQGFYIAGFVLGLLFVIPSAWFPIVPGKVAFVALCLFIAAVLFSFSGNTRLFFQKENLRTILLVALLPFSYIFSYLFSIDKTIGITGYTVEPDTILFIVLGFLTFVLGFGLFRTYRSARALLLGVVLASGLAALFQFIVIIFGTSILPGIFADHSVNLVGKWNDLGILVGLLLLFVLVSLEFTLMTMRRRIVSWVVALVSLILVAIINFPLVWSLLIVFSIATALWSGFSKRPTGSPTSYAKMVPWMPVAGIVIFSILLLWGTIVNTGLTTVLPVSSLEVRPSFSSTVGIIKTSHGSSALRFMLGSGPNTFSQEWLVHKPLSVNQSLFWNLDFNVGYSTFITTLCTIGLLGIAALLMPLMLCLLMLVYTLRSKLDQREKHIALCLALGSLYLWGGVLFYIPSEIMILLTYALSGATLGFVLQSRQTEGEVQNSQLSAMRWITIAASVILVLLSCWSAFLTTRRAVAESYANQGLIALQQGAVDKASSAVDMALRIEEIPDTLRLNIDVSLARLQQIGSTGTSVTDAQKQEFATLAQGTIAQGKRAIQMSPLDYRVFVSIAKVYDYLASLGVPQAYENAKEAYQVAENLNPTSPEIPLLMARLEAVKGNLQGTTAALQQSLTLKPDYTDAILFVVQLDVAQKDIPNAIRAAQAAVQSAPGVPSIWFELGLLYYAAGDTKDAIPPLQEAIKRQNDYANAKYFLGLSLAAQNQTQDAIQEFQDLGKSNPDNAEVKLILSNLQSGKDPFANAQPPVTNKPENRTSAPIPQ